MGNSTLDTFNKSCDILKCLNKLFRFDWIFDCYIGINFHNFILVDEFTEIVFLIVHQGWLEGCSGH